MVVGSPVRLVVVPHTTPPPYLLCDSSNTPSSSVAAGAATRCRVYGISALPGQRRVTTWTNDTSSGNVTEAVVEDTTGSTFVFEFTAGSGAGNTTALVGVSVSGASVALSPTTVDITGVVAATQSTSSCSPPFQPVAGYMVRGDLFHCVIHAADAGGRPVRALLSDFTVAAGVGASVTNVVGHDGGRRLTFDITAPLDGRVYDITVVITVATGPDAGVAITGPGVWYLLTDVSPPEWTEAPALHSVGRGTAILQLYPSEPCQL